MVWEALKSQLCFTKKRHEMSLL